MNAFKLIDGTQINLAQVAVITEIWGQASPQFEVVMNSGKEISIHASDKITGQDLRNHHADLSLAWSQVMIDEGIQIVQEPQGPRAQISYDSMVAAFDKLKDHPGRPGAGIMMDPPPPQRNLMSVAYVLGSGRVVRVECIDQLGKMHIHKKDYYPKQFFIKTKDGLFVRVSQTEYTRDPRKMNFAEASAAIVKDREMLLNAMIEMGTVRKLAPDEESIDDMDYAVLQQRLTEEGVHWGWSEGEGKKQHTGKLQKVHYTREEKMDL